MAKAIWTGSLSFGLVNVPVGLYSATEDKSIHFNQFHVSADGSAERVRIKRVDEATGEEVAYSDIVKGYDLGGGEYVIITPEELASVAPGASKTIDVTDFVDLEDIDPVYFDRPYYVAPQGKASDRAYALLLEAMTRMHKVAIAHFVMREKEYLVAVRPHGQALVLETLRFADEVRNPAEEIDALPVDATFDDRELEMAKLLIDSMTTGWEPDRYRDTYREQVEELIEQKRSGAVIVTEAPGPAPAPVVNLLDALQASVDAARSAAGRRGPASASSNGGGREPAGRPKASAGSAGSAGSATSSRSKTDLLRQAAELGIAGRSKMDRDELEAAINQVHAESGAGKGRRRKAS